MENCRKDLIILFNWELELHTNELTWQQTEIFVEIKNNHPEAVIIIFTCTCEKQSTSLDSNGCS